MNARLRQLFCLCLYAASLPLLADETQRGALRVRFIRGAEKGAITVRVTRPGEREAIAVKTVPRTETAVSFDALELGRYDLLVEGDEPLKRLATFALVKPGKTEASVALPAGMVFGRVTLGGHPYKTEVTLTHSVDSWSTKLTTDDEGTYASGVWRRGEFDVAVSGRGIQMTTVGTLTIPDGLTPRVDFDVPDRQVTGRVTTADGAPVSGAVVALETTTPGFRRATRRTTDANGEFLYFGVGAGSQSLRVVSAEGHLRPDAVQFALGAADTHREVAVVLKTGQRRRIEVVDHHEAPSAGTTIVCVTNGEIRSVATTDAKGWADLATPLGEASTLYVLPHEGSLAVQRLDGGRRDASLRIRVPPGTAAIDLLARVTDGAALPEVAFLVRFNGDIIPPEVVREMQRHQGVRLQTDERGVARLPNVPPGYYEFWPVRTDDEIVAIVDTAGAIAPPISLNARVGENRVTVRFEKKRH